MDDDDLAGKAQQLLDAVEGFLGNKDLVEQLSPEDLIKLRKHKAYITKVLAAYRALHYLKKPKGKHPAKIPTGSLQGMLLPVAIGGTTLSPVLGKALTGIGPRVVTSVAPRIAGAVALAEILWPFALAVGIDLALGGGSPRAEIARKLVEAVNALGREILALDAMTTVLMLTAAEIAKMTLDELLQHLDAAIRISRLATVALILEELLKRFPACANAINTLRDLVTRLHRLKTNPITLKPSRRQLEKLADEIIEASKALESCILGSTPTPPKPSET